MNNEFHSLESILDINSNNIWMLDPSEVAELWEISRNDAELGGCENKLLNIIRLAFDVNHFNPQDERDVAKYQQSDKYAIFSRVRPEDGCVAVSKRTIRRITDITYENIKHITTQQLLTLINDNFGGGWDAIPLQIKDIIESGFEVTTTTLPTRRLHSPGGTLERKVADGYDVLEIEKGTWVEAIFAKKKEPLEKVRLQDTAKYDSEGNRIHPTNEDGDEDLADDTEETTDDTDNTADDETIDETYYETYIPEADSKDEEEEDI